MICTGYIPTFSTVLKVSAEFILKKHSGGFIRERGTLSLETNWGTDITYRGLPPQLRAHMREQIKEWSANQIRTLNASEDLYREKAERESA